MTHSNGKRGLPSSWDADMVRASIRDKIEKMGVTQAAYAEMCGYTPQHLRQFLCGSKGPGPKILDAEGLQAVTYYEFKDAS